MSGELLKAHRELDALCRDRRGRLFISDWYCEHPFATRVLPRATFEALREHDLLRYCFQNDSHELHQEIARFHAAQDGNDYGPDEIYVSSGLSSLITAQMLWLRHSGVKQIHYVRPLYYTYYYLAEVLGVELVPVNAQPLVTCGADLRLPPESGSTLLLCDPVWCQGRPITDECIEAIAQWQAATESLILVDGAFQYLRWKRRGTRELTALLDRDRTIRNLCPTKTVAVHGPRFAYALTPAGLWDELRYAYANSSGSSSVFDHGSAMAIMRYLNGPDGSHALLDLIEERYASLVGEGAIVDSLGAEAGYFCFVETPVDPARLITMDQRFFDTTGHDGLVRFNLLLPAETIDAFIALARETVAAQST